MKFRSIALLVLTAIFSSINYRALADKFPSFSNYLIAQNIRNFCVSKETIIIFAETKDFWINICGTSNPATYIGVSKKDGKIIRLPLSYSNQQEVDYYEAINGNYTYYLFRTTKGDFLRIYQENKPILLQQVLNWQNW
jgi:hypothetical protein